MNVYVLVTTHRHGDDVAVYRAEHLARHALADWCREWWHREAGADKPMPKDDESLVAEYFEVVDGHESFEIYERELI